MTVRTFLGLVGAAVGGLVGGTATPAADPVDVRRLLQDLGVRAGPGPRDLARAVRSFQRRAGLIDDGIAGPRTVHHLVRYAGQASDRSRVPPLPRPRAAARPVLYQVSGM